MEFVDITDRKNLELSLKERNTFLNNVFESLTHPFYVINIDDYTIAAANPASKARGDYYEGITCYALTHHSNEKCGNDPDHPCPIEVIKKTKKPHTVVHTHFTDNNKVEYHEVNAFPIFDENGNLIQVIESSYNITERVLAHEKIKNLNIELEQKVKERTNELNEVLSKLQQQHDALQNFSQNLELSNITLEKSLEKEKEIGLLKSQFVSMISHEYRTPLTIILTSSELIERYVNSNELDKMPKLINRIQVSVSDMEKMLEDILLLGKTDKGLIKLKNQEVDIISIIEELTNTFNVYVSKDREIILNNQMNNKNSIITTDIHFLKQIIQNIILNAHKYSPIEKPIILDIRSDSKSSILLDITDFGKGINDKEIGKIFDPFYRDQQYVGSIRGHGLGLSIVKKLADALNIQIRVSSELEKGSKFSLYIPTHISE